jgi:hypothetical protein
MIRYLVNNEFQRMWEEAKNSIVSVELDNITKDCGPLVKILGGGECLKHLVVGQQLHIDYNRETTSVEKTEVAESGYSVGSVIIN